MDISQLLKNAPELIEQLQGAGFEENKIDDFASQVGQQVAGDDGFDLTDILTSLDADAFLSKVDANVVAEKLGLAPELVNKGLQIVAPMIEQFAGDKLGALGSLASRFLK